MEREAGVAELASQIKIAISDTDVASDKIIRLERLQAAILKSHSKKKAEHEKTHTKKQTE